MIRHHCGAGQREQRHPTAASMTHPPRKLAFVIAATDHGTMIVSRFDEHRLADNLGFGVGFQLLDTASYDQSDVALLLTVLDLRRRYHGDGVVAVDCGANIGVHTVEWAKHMTSWGVVVAIEAQDRIYYALAGNLAINNCFNARAIHAAVTSAPGSMKIPNPNYLAPASFGSLELKKRDEPEFIGQDIDYSEGKMVDVRAITLDAFNFPRLDLIKIDVEGMELDALAGATKCIVTHRPILLIEAIKVDGAKLRAVLESLNYSVVNSGINVLAIHKDDACLAHVEIAGPKPG
jgi:FkbM family methyltransferase